MSLHAMMGPALDADASAYIGKPARYFTGARRLFIDDLPAAPAARLLEVGCGNGATCAYAKATGKAGWCAGVELCPEPAAQAAAAVDQVILGDVESADLPFPPQHFDALILSEVLEHLRDPWAVLQRLHALLKPGAWVMAGSPNVAYYKILLMQLRGRWDYEPMGVMDRTHLRWFTAATYRQMFEECGYRVEWAGPARSLHFRERVANVLSLGTLQHTLHQQIYLRARRA